MFPFLQPTLRTQIPHSPYQLHKRIFATPTSLRTPHNVCSPNWLFNTFLINREPVKDLLALILLPVREIAKSDNLEIWKGSEQLFGTRLTVKWVQEVVIFGVSSCATVEEFEVGELFGMD